VQQGTIQRVASTLQDSQIARVHVDTNIVRGDELGWLE
jgi:hypothetical protein